MTILLLLNKNDHNLALNAIIQLIEVESKYSFVKFSVMSWENKMYWKWSEIRSGVRKPEILFLSRIAQPYRSVSVSQIFKISLCSSYLTGLASEIRLKVIIMHRVLLVEGAVLHWNWKGCNKIKLLLKPDTIICINFQPGKWSHVYSEANRWWTWWR